MLNMAHPNLQPAFISISKGWETETEMLKRWYKQKKRHLKKSLEKHKTEGISGRNQGFIPWTYPSSNQVMNSLIPICKYIQRRNQPC